MQKNHQRTFYIKASVLVFGLFLSACARPFSTRGITVESEVESIVCPQNYEVTLDFFRQLIQQKTNLSGPIDEQAFYESLAIDNVFKGVDGSYLKSNLYAIYQEFLQDVTYLSSYEANPNLTELVSVLKIEDTENHIRKELVEKYKFKINQISQNMKSMGYSCTELSNPRSEAPPTKKDEMPQPQIIEGETRVPSPREVTTKDLILAMRKVFAVTYQSCQVLDQKPLDKDDKNLEGVHEKCCYENTQAMERHIASLKQVVETHPYIQDKYSNQCFDLTKNPLIYDFGGRPSFTNGVFGQLNFFANSGGSEVLGYDCSALVYTVLMGGGFRLKENKVFVASDIEAAQSRQFLDPEAKGWSCLNSVIFKNETSEPLLEGDVATMDGHTFMIYRVGRDPYGIENIRDCKKIDIKNFDFDIIQSSPSKDGVGVNVYVARDYLMTTETMRNGFVEYAKNYCERVKNGSKKNIKLSYFSLVRMSTKPACRMPMVQLKNESCVRQCI